MSKVLVLHVSNFCISGITSGWGLSFNVYMVTDCYQKTLWFYDQCQASLLRDIYAREHSKLKTGCCRLSSQFNLPWVCFLTQAFSKVRNFSKIPYHCGWWVLKNWCLILNADVTFWVHFLIFPASCIRLRNPPTVVYICWR